MRLQKIFENMKQGRVRNVHFDDFMVLIKDFGFRADRISQDYWVFVHPALRRAFPVLPCDWKVKPFQVLQLLRIVETFNLAVKE